MADAEAERKAKAARAKKLLAQRQKAKAAGTNSSIAPSSPASTIGDVATVPSARTSLSLDESAREEVERVVTPVLQETLKEEAGPAGNGPASDPSDLSKVPKRSSAGRDGPEPAVKDGPVGNDSSANSANSATKLQETISLLIHERSDLQARISVLEAELSKAKGDSQLLEEGRALISRLEEEKRELEDKLGKAEQDGTRVRSVEDELEQVQRDLESTRAERDELVKERDEAEAKRIAAEEGVEEKVGGVEKQLERVRERESGLEAEIARLRQNNTELSSNVETISAELDTERTKAGESSTAFTTLRGEHDSLQAAHSALRAEHDSLRSQHDELSSAHAALREEHDASSSSSTDLSSTLVSTRAELDKTRGHLERAAKRADEAERKRAALQGENDELVAQLEEIRGRIMQVVEEKAELASVLDSERRAAAQRELVQSEDAGRIRGLEAALHASASQVHTLQRQLALADTGAGAGAGAGGGGGGGGGGEGGTKGKAKSPGIGAGLFLSPASPTESPAAPAHAHSYSHTNALEPRRPSGSRSIDAALPAAVRHRRQVSLSALKARMEPRSTPRTMESVAEDSPIGHGRRQFGDEIVFCCPACEGDLISL